MDFFASPEDVLAVTSVILLLLLNTHRALSDSSENSQDEDSYVNEQCTIPTWEMESTALDCATSAALHQYRLFCGLSAIDEDLGFWVRPRSTTWFTKFLMEEYDDSRWIQMFRMTKRSVFSLTQLLAPLVRKADTKYRMAVPVTVRIACSLFKLSHGASLLICSELFAVGRSTVCIMLRQVVNAVNTVLRSEIAWPTGEPLVSLAADFQNVCGIPGVCGAIDGTHFTISKPKVGAHDYYYFKSGAYTMNCQAVVDSSRRFLDLYVGMPGSTNDSRMLRRSTLFFRGQRNSLWDPELQFAGFKPFLVGDAGFPLLPWLMVPHRQYGNQSIANQLFNRRLSKGRVVVENAFGQLKLTFRELLLKTDLHVHFVPDVVTCCAILHNVLLRQSHADVELLLDVLRQEQTESAMQPLQGTDDDWLTSAPDDVDATEATEKRLQLGVYLTQQRLHAG